MTARFGVLDLETTGLFPRGRDRIVEIGFVALDASGRVEDEYTTLVNPARDVGPTSIHGLTASDVAIAPSFAEVAGDLTSRLRGRVIVGHNVRFDLRFLTEEMRRLGLETPAVPSLCTMALASRFQPGLPSQRLECCLAAFGIDQPTLHSALADAQATAALLRKTLAGLAEEEITVLAREASAVADGWPRLPGEGRTLPRGQVARPPYGGAGLIQDLLRRVPALGRGKDVREYSALLERALEDLRLTPAEVEALAEVAIASGLGRREIERLHEEYLRSLVGIAAADGVISRAERSVLDRVAGALGYPPETVERITREIESVPGIGLPGLGASGPRPQTEEELRGATVCFTGESQAFLSGERISRRTAEILATNAGLVVVRSVTKRLDLLVLADPESASTKARRAREYGIRLMAESAFWRRIGAPVEGLGPP